VNGPPAADPGAAGAPRAAFHYDLPADLVAQEPAARRGDSRLLLVERGGGVAGEIRFAALPSLLEAGDVLVVNDSRVLPARLRLRREPQGGRVEILLVHAESASRWLALARPARRLRPGQRLVVAAARGEEADGPPDGTSAATQERSARDAAGPRTLEIVARHEGGYLSVTCPDGDPLDLAARYGEVPLPPYIHRRRDGSGDASLRARDRERYQTVYARVPGSVAAPTAGLHFEPEVLSALGRGGVEVAGVTLHVGPGTFRPPTAAQIHSGRLHGERFHYPPRTDDALRRARAGGGRIIAVGTTALRVLETVRRLDLEDPGPAERRWHECGEEPEPVFTGSARRHEAGWEVSGWTRLFIRPPHRVGSADGLLTNFHLPGSSLLMLLAAFAGERTWRAAYDLAVRERFRFFSYGDAMFVLPAFDRS
jgi:S-adenosylmethionine:tRNA ribosyltransferase-isomerase